MTLERASRVVHITLISIAIITLLVSYVAVTISRVFDCREWAKGEVMDLFISSIAPFAGAVSLIVINIHAVFDMLPATKAQKLVVQTFTDVIYKGAFVPLAVPPTLYQARLWSGWLIMIFSLKMFLGVARIRLQQLVNAYPCATPWTDMRIDAAFHIYSILLVNLAANAYWMMHQTLLEPSSVSFLLFFEPLSIAFQTLHASLVHGFQLLDIWLHYSHGNTTNSTVLNLLHMAVGSVLERKRVILRDVGFFLDIMSLLMSLGHYVCIWQLHGMTFHLLDAMLFLPILSLLIGVVKRTWKFITELRMAWGNLDGATVPDAK